MKETWTVTGNGTIFKISSDKSECERFVQMQKEKKAGGKLNTPAASAGLTWVVRQFQPGDKLS